jgi:hypothetical protein
MRNKIPRISNEEVISAFSTGVSDVKMREKLSVIDELTSVVRLFEITDRCAKAEEGRLFVHNLPEALPQSRSLRTPSERRLLSSWQNLIISNATGAAPNMIKVYVAATAFSTRRTPTILTIVGLSESFMKKMVSPSRGGGCSYDKSGSRGDRRDDDREEGRRREGLSRSDPEPLPPPANDHREEN